MTEVLEQLDLKALRQQAKESLYSFSKGILLYDWIVPHIHGSLCKELEDTSSNNKLIVLPRGWLKTTLCSICFPMWLSVNNPNIRCLLVQNSHVNACKKLAVIARQWEGNPLLRALFPELLPGRNSTWKADSLCLTRGASFPESTYEAAGTSSKVISRHYDVIIEDDTVAPDYDELGGEALAPTHDDVQKAIGWHKTNVIPLFNNPKTGINLVVGTRWYDQDLIRWIMDNEPDFKVITRAVRENDEGKPDPKGHITYPERFDEEDLKKIEARMGPYMMRCLYYNSPVLAEDMLFKAEWFKYYDKVPRTENLMYYTTVDLATDPKIAKSDDIDFNVVITTAKDMCSGEVYVVEYFQRRCNPGELCSAIFDHVVKYRPILVGVPKIAYESSLIYWLKELMRQHQLYFVVEPMARHGKDAKVQSISALQPVFAAGAILIRPHMKELVSELLKFPLGDHDDIADALSLQMKFWKLTKITRQIRQEAYGGDALSFDSAVASIRERSGGGLRGPIFEPLNKPSTLESYAFPRVAS